MTADCNYERVYRAVHGAVRNVAHAHPRWHVRRDLARSVAKRAAGTLTAARPDALAAHAEPSAVDDAGLTSSSATGEGAPQVHPSSASTRGSKKRERGGIAGSRRRRSPLSQLWDQVSLLAGDARRAGNRDSLAAYADVLRLIDHKIKHGSSPWRRR